MGIDHHGPRNFERFCCSYKLFPDISEVAAIANATAPCFRDLNITQDEQIRMVVDMHLRHAYNYTDCEVSI